MRSIFEAVRFNKPKQSKFDLSHDLKFSMKMGTLTPTCCIDTLPGDVFKIRPINMLRFLPLVAPVMHEVRVTTDYFFVPNRILWPEWEKFITGGQPGDPVPEHPYLDLVEGNNCVIGSLGDFLGIPTGTYGETIRVSSGLFAIAAYLKIWDEYYRDQNLQDERYPDYQLVAGSNPSMIDWIENATLLRRAWEHDYLTSALPFAQKGDAVQIPLTAESNIPVEYDPNATNRQKWLKASDGETPAGFGSAEFSPGSGGISVMTDGDSDSVDMDPNGTFTVDVQAGATDINTLRLAFRFQEWLEKNARGGTRYAELMWNHFFQRSSDARLQRPEFIGRQTQKMVISETLATAQDTDANVPVGYMAGHGISVGGGKELTFKCEEHGWIIGLISVIPRTAYSQGIPRKFTRETKLDFAWPTFANIGEQAILRKEVKAVVNAGTVDPNDVWGYIPRYAEYKFENSRVAGEMRDTLNFWHLGRELAGNGPSLNASFIECNPSTRIFAVTDPDEDHIVAHVFNQITAIRKLPYFGTPAI